MAYVKTVWATGDVITAEKLNKAEEGIEANSRLVYMAKAEKEGAQIPVITEGDFDDACACIEAGGIVSLSVVTTDGSVFQYYSCAYYTDEPAVIDLFSVNTQQGQLKPFGLEWAESGLAEWPSE